MFDRADAHMHLFEGGYREGFAHRPGVQIDEALLYASLAADHGVKAALVVGYEGHPWSAGNNAHIAALKRRHAWIRPLAYVHPATMPGPDGLGALSYDGFVGLSMYIFSEMDVQSVQAVSDEVWGWISQRGWVVSLNTRGEFLPGWQPVLARHPDLRLVVSHLGLPPRLAHAPSIDDARSALAGLSNLSRFSGVHVKLSGFYAVTEPGHDYPHRGAWPYVQVLLDAFGASRLLWGSDFAPSLEHLSFPQTFSLFESMPFLSAEDRRVIQGANLLRLLDAVQ